MHSEGLCDAPCLGMHVYMLVQTCGGSFMVAFTVKTQRVQNHNMTGIHHSYEWYMTVIFHVYLWHLVTLEKIKSVHVKTHSIYRKRWWMPCIHSIGYKNEFSPNKKCCHTPVIWQVYDTTCHMTGIWQSYTLSKLSGDSRWNNHELHHEILSWFCLILSQFCLNSV